MTYLSDKQRKRRQPFSSAEDETLKMLVSVCGDNDWAIISNQMPGRTPRQCRDRWKEYLMPSLNISEWTAEEDARLLELINEYGRRWSAISTALKGRSETSIKNRWRLLERRNKNGQKNINEPQQDHIVIEPCSSNKNQEISVSLSIIETPGKFSIKDLNQFFNSIPLPQQSKQIDQLLFSNNFPISIT